MFFKTPFNYDPDIHSFSSGLDCSNSPDRAQQHMKDECDINTLVKLYARTGQIPGADLPATEFQFDEVYDFQTAMNAVIEAEKSFASLPSHIRYRFHNNPAEFLSFVDNDRNRDEAIQLGLIPKPDPLANLTTTPNSQKPEDVNKNPTDTK